MKDLEYFEDVDEYYSANEWKDLILRINTSKRSGNEIRRNVVEEFIELFSSKVLDISKVIDFEKIDTVIYRQE